MQTFGNNEGLEDKESWRPKHMCRSSGAEIYDLAWSPDGQYFIVGSMDNVARIYSAGTGAFTPTMAHSEYQQRGSAKTKQPNRARQALSSGKLPSIVTMSKV